MATAYNILMLVENLPVPPDPRIWAEATTLRDHGFQVRVICPKGSSRVGYRVWPLSGRQGICGNRLPDKKPKKHASDVWDEDDGVPRRKDDDAHSNK